MLWFLGTPKMGTPLSFTFTLTTVYHTFGSLSNGTAHINLVYMEKAYNVSLLESDSHYISFCLIPLPSVVFYPSVVLYQKK